MRNLYVKIGLICLISLHVCGQWEFLNRGIKGELNAMDFIDDQTGWFAGGRGILMATTDGRATWTEIPQPKAFDFMGIDFVNTLDGWATGWDNDQDQAVILQTTDRGYTWTVRKEVTDANLIRPQVLDDSIIFASGIYLYQLTAGGFMEVKKMVLLR